MPGCGCPGAYGRCPCHVLTLRALATVAALACASAGCARGLPFVRSLASAYGCVSASGHSGRGEVVPLWSDLCFPEGEQWQASLYVPLGPVWFPCLRGLAGGGLRSVLEALCRESRRRPQLLGSGRCPCHHAAWDRAPWCRGYSGCWGQTRLLPPSVHLAHGSATRGPWFSS